jgi:hypothetical protein
VATPRPGPVLRRLLRAPSLLYDWHAGWLLGRRFLRLTHRGRRSGRRYRTVLEVVGTGRAPWRYDGSADARRQLAGQLPLVAFRPR